MEMVWPCSCLHTRHSEHDCDWSVNILLICDWSEYLVKWVTEICSSQAQWGHLTSLYLQQLNMSIKTKNKIFHHHLQLSSWLDIVLISNLTHEKIIKNLLTSYFLTWHRSPHLWSHKDVVFSGWWWQPPERDRKEYYLWVCDWRQWSSPGWHSLSCSLCMLDTHPLSPYTWRRSRDHSVTSHWKYFYQHSTTDLAARHGGVARDGETHRTHDRLLQLPQEALRLCPLLLQLLFPLHQPCLGLVKIIDWSYSIVIINVSDEDEPGVLIVDDEEKDHCSDWSWARHDTLQRDQDCIVVSC